MPSDGAGAPTTENWMTRSQFGKVLFHDVDDTYPTNQDLRVHFSLTPTVTPASGDRIGLYRMTNVAPSNAVCFLEVGLPDSHAGGEAEMQMQQPVRREIVFSAEDLPDEEDFYLYQYVRDNEEVAGASVPFQLKNPSASAASANDDFGVVEDDEEFQVVQSSSGIAASLYRNRVQEVEKKYSDLLEISERLTEDLNEKQESFVVLDNRFRMEKAQMNTLKEDLAKAVAAKVELEKNLCESKEQVEKLQCSLAEAQARGEQHANESAVLQSGIKRAQEEKALFVDEATAAQEKIKELNEMLSALNKAKELTVKELKAVSEARDAALAKLVTLETEMQAKEEELQSAKQENIATQGASEQLRVEVQTNQKMLDDLKKEMNIVQDLLTDQQEKTQVATEAKDKAMEEVAKLNAELQAKEMELQQESVERQSSSEQLQVEVETKQKTLDDLKKEINIVKHLLEDQQEKTRVAEKARDEATQKLALMKAEIENKENELHAEKREYTARQMASEKLRIEGETTQQQLSSSNVFLRHENEKLKNELEQLKQNQVQNAAQGPDSQDNKAKFENSQDCISQLNSRLSELQSDLCKYAPSSELESLRRDVDRLRTMSVGSYAPSESDSTRNFDSFVITEALNLSLPQQAAAAAAPVVKQPEGVTSLLTTVEAAAASSAAAIQAPSPQIPCSPPTQAQSPQVRSAPFDFLPNFPGSVAVPQPQQQQLHQQQQLNQQQLEAPVAAARKRNQDQAENSSEPLSVRSSVENEATTLTEDPVSTEQSHQTQDEEEQMQVAPAAAEGHEEEEPLSGSSFELNDGGVPIPVPAEGADGVSNTTLKCPMCPVEFVPGFVRELEFHVESHLVTKLNCPVCLLEFQKHDQETYEIHVQSHFGEDEAFQAEIAPGSGYSSNRDSEARQPAENPTNSGSAEGRQPGSFMHNLLGDWDLGID